MSSSCSPALNFRTASRIAVTSAGASAWRWLRSVSRRRASPNSSSPSLLASVMPSLYSNSASPGARIVSATAQSHASKAPRMVAVAGAVERLQPRDAARQESRLHFLRQLELDRGASLGLEALGDLPGESDVLQRQRRLARHRRQETPVLSRVRLLGKALAQEDDAGLAPVPSEKRHAAPALRHTVL